MNIYKEISEDVPFLKEYATGEAGKSYEFSGRYGPIIGIHGVFGGWMKDGVRSFMQENSVAGKLVFWGNLIDGLETYLPKLDREIANYENSILLGYSAGGIVTVLYAERFKAWDKIKKIITIGSPFAGIDPKLGVIGKSLREMIPGNPIMKEVLNANPPENKVLSLFASEDKFTHHPEKLKLNWPIEILAAKSHGDIQNHYKWMDNILRAELEIN